MKGLLSITASVVALSLAAPVANAALYTVEGAPASSVSLTETGGGGLVCFFSNCGIEADLASGAAGTSFDLSKVGDSFTFDFITFEVDGTTGLTPRTFDISASLALDPPGITGTGTGDGGAFLALGTIVAGELEWTSQPGDIAVGDGRIVNIEFEDGLTFFAGGTETVAATVTLAAVPLPAAGFVLLSALAGAGVAYRRRKTV